MNGFWMLKNPVMRRTMARGVSVAQAARMHKIQASEFVDSLNAAIACR